jgi:hypothetical protein
MSVIVPIIFTPIEDIEVSFERPNSEEILRKLSQNINMLGKLAIIGSIRAIALNQQGVLSPDSIQWQRADGSEITEGTSPLRTTGITNRFTPDMRDRYIRGADASTTIFNELAGNALVNLRHAHTGITGGATFATVGEEGNEQRAAGPAHTHSISPELSSTEPLEVANQQIDMYLKIT